MSFLLAWSMLWSFVKSKHCISSNNKWRRLFFLCASKRGHCSKEAIIWVLFECVDYSKDGYYSRKCGSQGLLKCLNYLWIIHFALFCNRCLYYCHSSLELHLLTNHFLSNWGCFPPFSFGAPFHTLIRWFRVCTCRGFQRLWIKKYSMYEYKVLSFFTTDCLLFQYSQIKTIF